MRTISDLVRAIAKLVLGRSDIDYDLLRDGDKYADLDRAYRRLKDLVGEGSTNDVENLLTDELNTDSPDCLGMALTLYMYLNQLKDEELHTANYSREEIVNGINSVYAEYGVSRFEHFVDTTMV